jgi:hypothetical protein
MDRTPITAALVTAKTIVMSHGISGYLPPHMKTVGTRPVEPTDSGFRLEYVLDPSRSMWQDNPGCSIHVSYMASKTGQRTTEEGAVVLDHHLNISVRASTDDMTIKRLKEREGMISNLTMLCEMLEVTLPQTVTVVVMTQEQFKDKTQRELEQATGALIHDALGLNAFKGLRKGGRSRFFRNPSGFASGTYNYAHVRRRNSRGYPIETAKYVISVQGETLTANRID